MVSAYMNAIRWQPKTAALHSNAPMILPSQLSCFRFTVWGNIYALKIRRHIPAGTHLRDTCSRN